jgi:hypothetical protein
MTLATLEGFSFYGDADAGAHTYSIEQNGIKNWLDGVDTRRETIARPDADGEFDVPGKLGGRQPTLSIAVKAIGEAALQLAIDDLMGILADGSKGTLAIELAGRTLTASVRRSGTPTIEMLNPKRAARVQLQLWSADPRRYGTTVHTFGPGSSVSGIQHAGNFAALPILRIAGGNGGYTVNGPGGKLITVNAGLGSGEHTLNLATGGLYIGGSRVFGGVSVYRPWVVPKNTSITVSVTAGTVAVDLRDTFV